MSEIERIEAIQILKYQYQYGQMEQDVHKALGMAINSLEVDEAYQLEYEHIPYITLDELKEIYSNALRVKHHTMSINEMIDKLWQKISELEGKE